MFFRSVSPTAVHPVRQAVPKPHKTATSRSQSRRGSRDEKIQVLQMRQSIQVQASLKGQYILHFYTVGRSIKEKILRNILYSSIRGQTFSMYARTGERGQPNEYVVKGQFIITVRSF